MAESKENETVNNKDESAAVEVSTEAGQAENPASEAKTSEASSDESQKTNDDSSKPAEEPSAELLAKIKKQVEFYFGDVNMQRDKFLIEQTKLDDGWVPMPVMLNFKMLASLSKDTEVILKALEDSDLIEISSDRKKIRRSPESPLPIYDEKYKKEQEAKTVYLKGFPQDTTMNVLKEYFEPQYAVDSIIMRKYKKGKEYIFKGSIFVLFKNLDDAKALMNQDSVKYKDTELIKLWLTDYVASKEKEKEEKRQKKAENVKGSNKNKKSVPEVKFPKGCIMSLSNCGEDCTKEKLKEKFSELECDVAFLDYSMGKPEGWVRFHEENSAVELLKKLDSDKIKVGDNEITCKVLEGEEEEAYFKKVQESMAHQRAFRRDRGRGGRRGFKRRHSPHRNENGKKAHIEN